MRNLFILLMAVIVFAFSGCVYMNITAPLDTDLNQTRMGSKTGQATIHSILWLVAWGDAGTKAAAENGGISVVNHMDIQLQSYLFGLYSQKTIVVYGD